MRLFEFGIFVLQSFLLWGIMEGKKENKFLKKLKVAVLLILNPRFLLCFGLGWIITNGWAYIMAAVGAFLGVGWMIAVSGAYLAFLWFPFTPEKVITVGIAIWLLRLLFPKDEKTLGVLRALMEKAKARLKGRKEKSVKISKN